MAQAHRLLGISLLFNKGAALAGVYILVGEVINDSVSRQRYRFMMPGEKPKCFLKARVKWAVCL